MAETIAETAVHIESELRRLGFLPPDRRFPGWHRDGIGVEVFDRTKKKTVEVMVWIIGDATTAHVLVAKRRSPSLRWLRDAVQEASGHSSEEEHEVADLEVAGSTPAARTHRPPLGEVNE